MPLVDSCCIDCGSAFSYEKPAGQRGRRRRHCGCTKRPGSTACSKCGRRVATGRRGPVRENPLCSECASHADPIYCARCGDPFRPTHGLMKYCSPVCRERNRCSASYTGENFTRECEECGDLFWTTVRAKRFCTESCQRQSGWDRRQSKIIRIPGRGYRRSEVLAASDRICWLCGGAICGQHPDPMSFSIDHVIPISKGGTDTRDNVRAAHLRCNIRRKDAEVESSWALADR